jgi:hypothetical protein
MLRGNPEKSDEMSQIFWQAVEAQLGWVWSRERNLQEFITSGSMSLLTSLEMMAVGNMRIGFGLNGVAGGHLRENCLTMG